MNPRTQRLLAEFGADPQVVWVDPPAETEQDWYFTFGHGQYGHALLDKSRIVPEELGEGFPLHNRYVILHGTYDWARARMERVFGQVWSQVYPDAESAGVEEYGLIELVIA